MTKKSVTLYVWQSTDIRVKVNQGKVNSQLLEIKILDKKKATPRHSLCGHVQIGFRGIKNGFIRQIERLDKT